MSTNNLVDRLLEDNRWQRSSPENHDTTSNRPKLTSHLSLAFSELQKAKTQIHALSDKVEQMKRAVPELTYISDASESAAEDFAASISYFMEQMENYVKRIQNGIKG